MPRDSAACEGVERLVGESVGSSRDEVQAAASGPILCLVQHSLLAEVRVQVSSEMISELGLPRC